MKTSVLGRYASGCVVVALLVGCASAGVTVPTANGVDNKLQHHKTFRYTGGRQSFKVPDGVKRITVNALGARGGGSGGNGGRVYATIPVTPEEQLTVFVGGQGLQSEGGFNGGGKEAGNVNPMRAVAAVRQMYGKAVMVWPIASSSLAAVLAKASRHTSTTRRVPAAPAAAAAVEVVPKVKAASAELVAAAATVRESRVSRDR
ncbi:MAG TPA: hypothetical protein VGI19_17215 [Candidatus Cybelea sp.]|jgi:hypothetical protein